MRSEDQVALVLEMPIPGWWTQTRRQESAMMDRSPVVSPSLTDVGARKSGWNTSRHDFGRLQASNNVLCLRGESVNDSQQEDRKTYDSTYDVELASGGRRGWPMLSEDPDRLIVGLLSRSNPSALIKHAGFEGCVLVVAATSAAFDVVRQWLSAYLAAIKR